VPKRCHTVFGVDYIIRDVEQVLATIRRALPQARDRAARGEWDWAAQAARDVLLARITLDRDVISRDIRHVVTDDNYLEAALAADEAKELLGRALNSGAHPLPRDGDLFRSTWTD